MSTSTIALTVAGCPMKSNLEHQVQERVGAVDGVESVGIRFDVMTPGSARRCARACTATRREAPAGGKKPITLHPPRR